MGKHVEEYTMSEATLNRLLVIRGVEKLICDHRNCDDSIEVGQRVISTNGAGGQNIYHKECYDATFVA